VTRRLGDLRTEKIYFLLQEGCPATQLSIVCGLAGALSGLRFARLGSHAATSDSVGYSQKLTLHSTAPVGWHLVWPSNDADDVRDHLDTYPAI
jgi:hypothetical protein